MGEVAGSVARLATANKREWKKWHAGFRARVEEALAADDGEALADLACEMRDCSRVIVDSMPQPRTLNGEAHARVQESDEEAGIAEQAEDFVALAVELRDRRVAAEKLMAGADAVLDMAYLKLDTLAVVRGLGGLLFGSAKKWDSLEGRAMEIERRYARIARPKFRTVEK